jgi:Tfp pilus assembly protein PilF
VDSRVRNLYPLRYRGELALLEGRVAEAVGLFEQALDLDPEYTFGWLGMAACSLFAGDRKRALKLYLRTVADEPGNHRAWLAGCGLMAELGFQGNAASWWRQLAERFPEHPAVRTGAGAPFEPVPA